MPRARSTVFSPLPHLCAALSLAGVVGGCAPRGTTTTPVERPPTPAPETAIEAPSAPAEALSPIHTVADFKRAIEEQFAGRIDATRGVVFLDIYDDESEEEKPIEAVRLCGEALEGRPAQWAAGLSARLQDTIYQEEQNLSCRGEHCWHEASEAGDFRGHFLFNRGVLQAVAWTSGPPAHIMSEYLAVEDEFVAEAVEALQEAPCGERYAGELRSPTVE